MCIHDSIRLRFNYVYVHYLSNISINHSFLKNQNKTQITYLQAAGISSGLGRLGAILKSMVSLQLAAGALYKSKLLL